MTIQLSDTARRLIEDPFASKALATVSADGVPHSITEDWLSVDPNGSLLVLELNERSQTTKNLVHSIWYARSVSILLRGSDGVSIQIRGVPIKAHVSGPFYQQHYVAVREQYGDVDLGAVWVIEPIEELDQSRGRELDEARRLNGFTHLDRLTQATAQPNGN